MPYRTRDLTGTVVAITGATAGIGAAAATQLVEAGAKVVLGGRREERLAEAVARLGASNAKAVTMDVQSPDDCRRLVAEAVASFGRLDAIVPNAGIGLYGSILDHSDAEVERMMHTNYDGTVWAVRAAVPAMLETTGGGDIVIVSSVAGLRGGGDEAVYAGTKFAQVGLAGALDRELREKGIRVTAICPAGVGTEFAVGTGRVDNDPRFAEWLTADDVAHAITTVLQQPREVRTTLWAMWSMGQGS
ncbi:MAG: SDR family oxidoreductase [Actinomycetota bacterium]|jgi:3-oxoacyl-[acyl-carrier protein] reductase|nr:SDR family oxidoreductase [Actinomycetota bacterium]